MTTNSTQVLALMLRHLAGVHASTQRINSQFRTMAIVAGGAMAAIGGAAALHGIWNVIEASKKLNDELTRTKQLGGEFASGVGQSRAAAFRTAEAVPTFAPSDLVRMQRELGSQMQNPQAAIDVLPMAARTAAVVSHFTGEDQETIIKNLIKIIDLRAKLFSTGPDGKEHVDPAKLGPELESAAKGLILGGNYIKSNDLLTMARQSGVPVKTMTPEAFYAAMMEMAVSQGASRAGTSTTSLFSQLVGGTMPVHTAVEMQKMGLMSGKEWYSDHGHVVISQDATQRFENALKDPIAFITGPLNEMMTKRGMAQDQKIAEVFKLFGRQTTQRLVAEALSAGPQFERARAMFGNIPNIDEQMKMLQGENLDMNIKAFNEAWSGLMESLGSAGIPLAISVLHGLTDALHFLSEETEKHPNIAADIMGVSAGVASLVAIGGGYSVIAFGLRTIAPALSGLAAITGLTALSSGLIAVAGGLSALAAPVSAMMAILKLGADAETPENRAAREKLRKDMGTTAPSNLVPQDGYGVDGRPIHKESFVAPNANRPQVQTVVYLQLDGRTLAKAVSVEQARYVSLPPSGSTRFDGRMTALNPGTTIRT